MKSLQSTFCDVLSLLQLKENILEKNTRKELILFIILNILYIFVKFYKQN